MILSEIRSEIQSRAGDNSLSQTQIDRWVNLGIAQWASRSNWPLNTSNDSSISTTASTREYTLPSDFYRMLSVKIGASSTDTEDSATELGYVRFEDRNVDNTTGYYLNPMNDRIGILPEPATTGLPVYLRYYILPTNLSGGTDELPFPKQYHELVIFFALKKYWETTDDFGKAAYYDREFENMIDQMKTDLMNRSAGSRPRIRDIREERV